MFASQAALVIANARRYREEQLLEVITFRRADGREIALETIPLAEALSKGETVRFEEVVMSVPDGRSVKALVNATPILTAEGEVESLRCWRRVR